MHYSVKREAGTEHHDERGKSLKYSYTGVEILSLNLSCVTLSGNDKIHWPRHPLLHLCTVLGIAPLHLAFMQGAAKVIKDLQFCIIAVGQLKTQAEKKV